MDTDGDVEGELGRWFIHSHGTFPAVVAIYPQQKHAGSL